MGQGRVLRQSPDEVHAEELPHLAAHFHEQAKGGDVDAENHRDRALASMAKRGIAPKGKHAAELRAIRERLGVTFVHVTGSETEALAMGDRVVVLDRGRIIQIGAPGDIYDRPASPDVAHYLNRFNLFEGRLAGGQFTGPFGTVPTPTAVKGDRDVYAVRYDRMRAVAPGTATSGPAIKATFIASEYLGSAVMNFFEAEDGHVIEMEHHLSLGAPQEFEPRQSYLLTWNPEQAIVFGREVR